VGDTRRPSSLAPGARGVAWRPMPPPSDSAACGSSTVARWRFGARAVVVGLSVNASSLGAIAKHEARRRNLLWGVRGLSVNVRLRTHAKTQARGWCCSAVRATFSAWPGRVSKLSEHGCEVCGTDAVVFVYVMGAQVIWAPW
jgi:hypothetical protein